MGEVYRAHDTRLGRDVAVKVVPEDLAADKDRLKRFEQEARATAALSHPNILALFDVGAEGDVHYIVEELLEGETLRERVRHARLPVHEAVDCGVQIARGLAAAHERGIVHRDLKPENVFLTRDGRVKILDFGLAKLRDTRPVETEAPTATAGTDAGTRMETVGYVSPEQARGEVADARSDIFSLGVVLYELLAGRRAFSGASAVETLNAILTEDPPELSGVGTTIPGALDRVIRRCLEKRPEGRFQSAHDVALSLEAASAPGSGLAVVPTKRWRPWQEWVLRGGLAAAIIAAIAGVFVAGRRFERKPVPSYHQLTFRRGTVDRARFASDGQTVVYSARWEGKPSEVFTARLDLAEAQALSLAQGAHLDAQHRGEALIHYAEVPTPTVDCPTGRLARTPLVGGTPRDVAENICDSDWGPTSDIAVIRSQFVPKFRSWLEYPIGKTLLESPEQRELREPRVSPRADRVALIVGMFGSNGGDVVVVDRSGQRTVLSSGWMELSGIAWSPDGREVWFTAGGPSRGGVGSVGAVKELHAVSLAARERLLLRMASDLTLRDVSRDGRVLLSHGRTQGESRGKLAGDEKERDLTYLDGTVTVGISSDGRAVLFQEGAQAAGPQGTVYLRRVGDSSPIRLGEGVALALSPDGTRAIASTGGAVLQSGTRFTLLSAGTEPPRELAWGTLDVAGLAWWTPDGRRMVLLGKEKDRAWRSYILQPPDGQPQPISPEGTFSRAPSQRWVPCMRFQEDRGRPIRVWELRSLDGGETRPAPWIGQEETVIAWSPDGGHAFVAGDKQPPFRVFRVDVATGRREPWLDTSPPDPAGVNAQTFVGTALTPDGRYYAYSYLRTLSDLFLVEGLR
jgi:Tol biopolymer transport system component